MSYRYILRYLIDPHFEPAARIQELVELCERACIDEVMLLFCAEELSAGHPTHEEIQPWIALAASVRTALQERGIALSLNPWSTIYHNQRGRSLHPGQNFRRMVGENGVESSVSVCPLCEEWQRYLTDLFARFVREIRPCALWVEDDWRLHNHDRAALGWGGCFCEFHLQRFSEAVGEKVSREPLLAALLRDGEPHPWRNVWLDLSRETIETPLARLAAALRVEDPGIRIGLMTSDPDQHSAEGRDWEKLRRLLAPHGDLLIRPHLPPYTQENPFFVPPSVTRHTIACVEGTMEIYPELENSPRCGPYSKSRRYTRWQMVQSAFYGSRGITINHFDMLGNGTALDPLFGEGLREAKPLLDTLADLAVVPDSEGVSVLFDPAIARNFRLEISARSLSDLTPHSVFWSRVFCNLGIAHRFGRSLEQCGDVVAVSGQTVRGLTVNQLEDLLSRVVLLDAVAASILVERGFGAHIGLQGCRWKTLQESAYSYEQIEEGGREVYGVAHPRLTAQRCATRLLDMQPGAGAHVLSTIFTAAHQALWPGAIEYHNALGGKIVTFCYPLEPAAQFSMGFFNVFRRRFLQRRLFRVAPQAGLAAVEDHPMHGYRLRTERGTVLAASNISDDTASEVVWAVSPGEFGGMSWETLGLEGTWNAIRPERRQDGERDLLSFSQSVPALGECVLRAITL